MSVLARSNTFNGMSGSSRCRLSSLLCSGRVQLPGEPWRPTHRHATRIWVNAVRKVRLRALSGNPEARWRTRASTHKNETFQPPIRFSHT